MAEKNARGKPNIAKSTFKKASLKEFLIKKFLQTINIFAIFSLLLFLFSKFAKSKVGMAVHLIIIIYIFIDDTVKDYLNEKASANRHANVPDAIEKLVLMSKVLRKFARLFTKTNNMRKLKYAFLCLQMSNNLSQRLSTLVAHNIIDKNTATLFIDALALNID